MRPSLFVSGFLLAIGVSYFGLRLLYRPHPPHVADGVPERYLDSIYPNSPHHAKSKSLFWLSDYDHVAEGVPLRLLENPELFASVFPGYERARQDKALWDSYFSHEFVARAVWSDLLNDPGGPVRLTTQSWIGCLEIFKRYGADVIIIGNSEVYQAVVPTEWAKQLAQRSMHSPRILNCSGHVMSLEMTERTIDELVSLAHERVTAILWGYSFWVHYEGSPHFKTYEKEHERALAQFRTPATSRWSWLSQKVRDYFPYLSWDLLKVPTLTSLRTSNKSETMAGMEVGEVKETQSMSVVKISGKSERNAAEIESTIKHSTLMHSSLIGATQNDCEFAPANRRVDNILKKMLTLSDRVYLYLPPVTPRMHAAAPTCFTAGSTALISSKAAPRVSVMTDRWESYHLDYTDFIYRDAGEQDVLFDLNHPNFLGASKVSSRLAAWVAKDSVFQGTRELP